MNHFVVYLSASSEQNGEAALSGHFGPKNLRNALVEIQKIDYLSCER